MKNDHSSNKTSALSGVHSPINENFRVEFQVKTFAGNEPAFELVGCYDIPLGMAHEHLRSTQSGNEAMFDNSLVTAMKIATTDFIEKRFRLGRKNNSTNPLEGNRPEQGKQVAAGGNEPTLHGSPPVEPCFHDPAPEMPQMPDIREDLFCRTPVAPQNPSPAPKLQSLPPSVARVASLPGQVADKRAA